MKKKTLVLLIAALFICGAAICRFYFIKHYVAFHTAVPVSSGRIFTYLTGSWLLDDEEYIFSGSNPPLYFVTCDSSKSRCTLANEKINTYGSTIPSYTGTERNWLVHGFKALYYEAEFSINQDHYQILNITSDEFTIRKKGSLQLFTLKRKKAEPISLDGLYQAENRTFLISGSKIYDCTTVEQFINAELIKESAKEFEIQYMDEKHLVFGAQIFSEIPIYKWREDQNGNLYLYPEGMVYQSGDFYTADWDELKSDSFTIQLVKLD